MQIDVITLFPEFFQSPLGVSLIARAIARDICRIKFTNPRDFTTDRHQRVDDEPYGGGAGMLMKPEPIFLAVESVPLLPDREIILLTPQGEPLNQALLKSLSQKQQLILVCANYEGVDERITDHLVTKEISLGDFVLTCGEIPALALINGVVRLLPGTVSKSDSLKYESFEEGLLEYPQYTRPRSFRGWDVPEVLLSGDHHKIAQWRAEQQLIRTQQRRPDLLQRKTTS